MEAGNRRINKTLGFHPAGIGFDPVVHPSNRSTRQ
jgi:hypothetical protein